MFVTHAADVLGNTSKGLSGPQIVKLTAAFAVDWIVTIPHATYPFTKVGMRTGVHKDFEQGVVDHGKFAPGVGGAAPDRKAG